MCIDYIHIYMCSITCQMAERIPLKIGRYDLQLGKVTWARSRFLADLDCGIKKKQNKADLVE